MKAMRLLFLGLLVFTMHYAQAQTLGINQGALSIIPSTVILDSTASVQATIIISDTSSTDYIGKIRLAISVNNTLVLNPEALGGSFFYDTLSHDTVPAHGFIQKPLAINFTSPGFGGVFVVGPSVVVIWPIDETNQHVHIQDSARATFTITSLTAGINDPILKNVKAYLVNDQLLIQTDAETALGRVRIFDIQGALLIDQQAHQNALIPMAQFASGMYLAEVTLADNRHQVFKVFKP